MKRKTKYILSIILLVLILFYLIGSKAINNHRYNNLLILKSYIPIPVKNFLKDYNPRARVLFDYLIFSDFGFDSSANGILIPSNPFSIIASVFDKSNLGAIL